MATTYGDPARMSQANRDLMNLQTLNDDLRTAYQESTISCDNKEEEITALRKEVSDLRLQNQANQSDAKSQISDL